MVERGDKIMPSLTLVRGDSNYYLEFEVRDGDGEIVDLSGSSVIFKMQKYGESTLTLSKAGNVVSGTLGLCQVYIETELQNKSGEFHAELQITWPASSKILTAPGINVKILQDLPR